MAKNVGKTFEDDWSKSYAGTNHFFLRLVDAIKWGTGAGARFTPSNVCDSIMCAYPVVFALELKSTNGTSFSYELEKTKKSTPMIKAKQIADLKKLYENNIGVIAGFIFNLRERKLKTKSRENQVWFVHIKDFLELAYIKGDKGSISEEDIYCIGIQVEATKKVSHYKYNIDKFANDVVVDSIKKEYIKRNFFVKVKDWITLMLSYSREDEEEYLFL